MTIAIHGLTVSRGVAIGRAVIVGRVDVEHYFITPDQVVNEFIRLGAARDAVVAELQKLQEHVAQLPAHEAPQEIGALLDVHLMLLQDDALSDGVKHWVKERLYNAEWALTTQLEIITRQFDEMEDEYLRERKGDLEQVVQRVLRHMATNAPGLPRRGAGGVPTPARRQLNPQASLDAMMDTGTEVPLVLIAHDLSPADMIQFKRSVFAGFVTDVGGRTSHTAIVARSLDIPAVVGARSASSLVRQDDWVIVDGDAGVVLVNPSPIMLAEYGFKQRQVELERSRLHRLRHTPCITLDGCKIELHANIEMPEDTAQALDAGALGVGLFRTEFLFMGRHGNLPDEQEQYEAYKAVIDGMKGMPVTIRTVDIGADKPLDARRDRLSSDDGTLNPALGLRAIRWSLADPEMFLTQLRAILRASAHGPVNLLIPMLAHASEIQATLAHIDQAREQLRLAGQPQGLPQLGAMIEVPAAALTVPMFLRHFDFLSIGTNDLISYTLAIDRADERVAHLYDPLHPAVLQLIAHTLRLGQEAGKPVSVCGEMAGDIAMTRLLLGMGLTRFSMHPTRILAVKQEILRADRVKLKLLADQVLASDNPASLLAPR